jgi:hypothetical protein
MTTVQIKPATAPLIAGRHRDALAPRHQMRKMYATVVSIEPVGEDEVYCLVVPGSESFTLANGLVTSNCFNCAKAQNCPLEDEFTDGGIRTPADAERLAGVRQQARAVDKRTTGWLMAWVDLHGPVPVKRAKGRLVLGYRTIKNGLRFEEFTPEGADRLPTEQAYDPNSPLVQAMKDSATQARKERVA